SLSIALAIIIVAYILFSLLRRHRTCTLFPYTTLFRSGEDKGLIVSATGTGKTYLSAFDVKQFNPERVLFVAHREQILQKSLQDRSEEHTSELQSRFDLVCRLLLEKKNKIAMESYKAQE